MRDCPQCGDHLVQVKVGEAHVEGCDSCGGVWFDHGELTSVATAHEGQLTALEERFAAEGTPVGPELAKPCPDCHDSLGEFELSHTPGIKLNGCAKCKGVWVDEGELQAIYDRLSPDADAADAPAPTKPARKTREKACQGAAFLADIRCPACGEPNPVSNATCWACGLALKERGFLCPRCDTKLQRQVLNEIRLDSCRDCSGVWLDRGELQQVVDQGPTDVIHFLRVLGEVDINLDAELELRDTLMCPRCSIPLAGEPLEVSDVKVDRCAKCSGAWADSGELAVVAEHFMSGGRVEQPPGPACTPASCSCFLLVLDSYADRRPTSRTSRS